MSRRVLFVTSNGHGMGHLTRLLATATRMKDEAEPVFASLSTAVNVVGQYGFPYEYIGSDSVMHMQRSRWNTYFHRRLSLTLDRVRPDVLVMDNYRPYEGLLSAVEGRGIALAWMRRAMWKPHVPLAATAQRNRFSTVIEPGDYAAAYDAGATTTAGDAHHVSPITLLSADELLSREQARAELGYGPDERVALVTLGSGNLHKTTTLQELVLTWFAQQAPGWRVVVTKAPIARGEALSAVGGREVETLQVYPLARYTRAFDVAVSAAGYNAFHEWILGGLPTVWSPNTATPVDDQPARCRWADDHGYGIHLASETPEAVDHALRRITDDTALAAMVQKLSALPVQNGADQAAQLILQTPAAGAQ